MLPNAEVLFISAPNTGLPKLADRYFREKLARAERESDITSYAVDLPADILPAVGPVKGRDELGNSFMLAGQPLGSTRVHQADLILTFTKAEKRAVVDQYPNVRHKVHTLGELGTNSGDIVLTAAPSIKVFEALHQQMSVTIDAGFERILDGATANRRDLMSRIGMSTTLLSYEFPDLFPDPTEKILQWCQTIGITCIDWSRDIGRDVIYSDAEMDSFVEMLSKYGLRCEHIHGFEDTTNHAVADGEAFDRYVAVQRNRIELCHRLGGDAVVIHIPGIFWSHMGITLPEALERSTRAVDQLRPLCEQYGIRLAVENYREQSSVQRLDFYLERYPELMGFCLDIGHANLVNGETEDMRAYGEPLCALHLHDNDGTDDHHQPPYFGTVDWPGLFQWIGDIGYERSINFELIYDRRFFEGNAMEYLMYCESRMREVTNLLPMSANGG